MLEIKNAIEFDDSVDSDGDLEIVLTNGCNEDSYFINKEEALAIVIHLKEAFGLHGH